MCWGATCYIFVCNTGGSKVCGFNKMDMTAALAGSPVWEAWGPTKTDPTVYNSWKWSLGSIDRTGSAIYMGLYNDALHKVDIANPSSFTVLGSDSGTFRGFASVSPSATQDSATTRSTAAPRLAPRLAATSWMPPPLETSRFIPPPARFPCRNCHVARLHACSSQDGVWNADGSKFFWTQYFSWKVYVMTNPVR